MRRQLNRCRDEIGLFLIEKITEGGGIEGQYEISMEEILFFEELFTVY